MKNADLIGTVQLPSGETFVFPMEPGVVIQHSPGPPYRHTGIVNREWIEAGKVVGRNYTPNEIKSGWPQAMEPHRLANLQFPSDSTGQEFINTAMISACESGQVGCTAFVRDDYALLPSGGRQLIESWTDYAIEAKTFAAWLTAQDMEPSPHIAAWFKAVGVVPAQELAVVVPAAVGPIGLDDVTTYAELVQYRNDYKERENAPAPWTDAQVDLMAAEITQRNGQKGIRKGIGGELGISVQRISELLREENKRPAETTRRTA